MRRNYNPAEAMTALEEQRHGQLTEANAILKNKTVANRARFHKALSRAEKAYPVREETDREAGWVLPSA
ncbi:hypothetical protein CULT_960022 [[Clostridium] ultunense Esp]|nr:hypothetical protein CULT_960022 [[Clostridium] ultunense Esp]